MQGYMCRRQMKFSVAHIEEKRREAGGAIASLISGKKSVIFERRTFLKWWGGRSICQPGLATTRPASDPFIASVSCGLFNYTCKYPTVAWGTHHPRLVCRRDARLSVSNLRWREKQREPGDPFIGDSSRRAHERFQRRRCKELLTLKPGQLWIQPPPAGCPQGMEQ